MTRPSLVLAAFTLLCALSFFPAPTNAATSPDKDAALAKAYRFERDGWIYVHLEGSPHDVGYQHGYLLSQEIANAFAAVQLDMTHNSNRDWEFFRRAGRQMLWPKIDSEYQAELQGIADGLAARKVKLDLDDIVAMNAFMELADYYVPWLDEQVSPPKMPKQASDKHDHCSAFVAAGSYTKNGQIVMAHNNWTDYSYGVHWNIIFDVIPEKGYAFLMDGFPGVIASDDDFGFSRMGCERQARVCARAQSDAVLRIDRRLREDHARRQ